MIVSLQRAAMILPFIGLAFYVFTKTWARLAIGYASLSIVIALGIAFSDAILERLDEVNRAIASEGRWARHRPQGGYLLGPPKRMGTAKGTFHI